MNKVPKLRFPEFSGEWEEYSGKKIFTILGGAAFSSKDSRKKGIKWLKIANVGINVIEKNEISYLPETIITNYSRYILNKGDIVIALTRPILNSKLKIAIIDEFFNGSLLNQRVGKIIETNMVIKKFLYYLIQLESNIKYLENMIAGTDPPNLSNNDLLMQKYIVPPLEEQQKIATFFSLIDKKIEKQQEKVEAFKDYKKGMMQKIFSREIRFKGDNGEEYPEWEHKKLNELVERVTRRNKSLISMLPLTISAQYGLVDQETFFNKTVASSNLENYFLLYKGEFAYNKSYSTGYPWGAIKRLDNYNMGVISSLYICFSTLKGINSSFLVHYFETNCWHKEISMIAVEGARNHGLLNISVNDFFETLHYIPSLEEQEKIANFLSTLDKKLEKEQEKLDYLNQWKKGLLQQMFV